MNLYNLILAFLIVEAYSSESFIKTAKGPTYIRCEQNSFILSNQSIYYNCDRKNSCYFEKTEKNKFFYVCLKEQFQKSKCDLLDNSLEAPEKNGCFHSQFHFVDINWNSKTYIHIFVLKLHFTDENGVKYSPFSTFSCLQCHLYFWSNTWILLKVSNKSEEDFGEFFMEDNPKTTFERKDEDITETTTFAPIKSTLPINKSTLPINKSTLPINKTFTVSSLDHGNNSSSKETPKNCLSVDKVIIILVAVVIVLMMIIIALVAFIFYRQKANKNTKAGTANRTNEIPLNENDTNGLNTYENLN